MHICLFEIENGLQFNGSGRFHCCCWYAKHIRASDSWLSNAVSMSMTCILHFAALIKYEFAHFFFRCLCKHSFLINTRFLCCYRVFGAKNTIILGLVLEMLQLFWYGLGSKSW